MKTKLTLTVLLAGSVCLATPAFAQTLTVSPNPVLVGQTITATLTNVCADAKSAEANLQDDTNNNVQVGPISIPITNNHNGKGDLQIMESK